jgi:hypothetical protein
LAAWQRWNRKLPHNRVQRRWQRDALGRKVAVVVVGPQPEPQVADVYRQICNAGQVILHEYHNARHAVAQPEQVRPMRFPLATLQRWDALLEQHRPKA